MIKSGEGANGISGGSITILSPITCVSRIAGAQALGENRLALQGYTVLTAFTLIGLHPVSFLHSLVLPERLKRIKQDRACDFV